MCAVTRPVFEPFLVAVGAGEDGTRSGTQLEEVKAPVRGWVCTTREEAGCEGNPTVSF